MKRLVVYSVLVGAKEPFDPERAPPGSDYDLVLFTDDPSITSTRWDVRPIDTHGLDPTRASRRPKLLAHRYLPDHEWSLYLDNNAALKVNPAELLARYADAGPSFFSFRHPKRRCLYDEAEEVIDLGYDDERRVREQVDHYRALGFPRNAGLIAATVMLRRHHDPEVVAVCEEWYEHVLRFSRRDQISFNFVAWRHGFRYGFIDGNLRDNPCVTAPVRPLSQRVTADFDPAVYDWLNRDVEASGLTPEAHFLRARLAGGPVTRFKRHDWRLRKRANRHRSDKGTIYYNAHGYADIYELMLRDRRTEPLRLLEIGLLRHDVQARRPDAPLDDVPSLKMWRDYLPNAEIYGFDIADFSAAPSLPGVHILRGDMGEPADLDRLVARSGGTFDVIVDDASHASHHQQIALGRLFPHLRPGGLYFIEDLHFQPSALEAANAVKTLPLLKALACGRAEATPHIDATALAEIAAALADIAFYDSVDRGFGRIHRDALAVLVRR